MLYYNSISYIRILSGYNWHFLSVLADTGQNTQSYEVYNMNTHTHVICMRYPQNAIILYIKLWIHNKERVHLESFCVSRFQHTGTVREATLGRRMTN